MVRAILSAFYPYLRRKPLGWVKHIFPEFEFTWLGDEMRQNLPKEMDFVHEAENAERATGDFKGVRTSLYIRKCLSHERRSSP